MPTYTVEWGNYQRQNGKIISQIQKGDIELPADSEDQAIMNALVSKEFEWVHAYLGSSKWL